MLKEKVVEQLRNEITLISINSKLDKTPLLFLLNFVTLFSIRKEGFIYELNILTISISVYHPLKLLVKLFLSNSQLFNLFGEMYFISLTLGDLPLLNIFC